MPIDANYDDDDEIIETKTKKPSKLDVNDSEAFPDGGFGSASAPAAAAPGGKSFASLASEVLPEQKGGLDLTGGGPIRIKVARPPVKPRITKVRAAYKSDETKRMGNFTMFHDEGMPAGVSEKKATCEMSTVSSISNIKDLNSALRDLAKLPMDDGANVRLFSSNFDEPSPAHHDLEKGGKYQIRVSKAISLEMFEELCLYFMDGRIDNAVVGLCYCIRTNFNLMQLWTKNAASAASVEIFVAKLLLLLGTKAEVTYARLADIYGKAHGARKFYLVENVPAAEYGAAMSVDGIVQMREFGSKKEKKKTKDDFLEVPGREIKGPSGVKKKSTEAEAETAEESGAETAANPYGFIATEDTDTRDTGGDVQFFEKKKSDKTRKGSTKKGSSKSKKSSNDDDLLLSGSSAGPLIPQQMFVGAGLAGVLLVALLAIFMSGALN
jgi:hypothetical protein